MQTNLLRGIAAGTNIFSVHDFCLKSKKGRGWQCVGGWRGVGGRIGQAHGDGADELQRCIHHRAGLAPDLARRELPQCPIEAHPCRDWEVNNIGQKGSSVNIDVIRSTFYYFGIFTTASKDITPAIASMNTLL